MGSVRRHNRASINETNKDICEQCDNRHECRKTCAPLVWVNGTAPCREVIMTNVDFDQLDVRDYKEVLHEVMRAKEKDHIKEIRTIEDQRIRAVAAMLHAGLKMPWISKFIGLSERWIYQMITTSGKNGVIQPRKQAIRKS